MKYDKPFKELGNIIKTTRLNMGMEQSELAMQVGSAQQTVSQWENGKSRPRIGQIGTLASALGLPEDIVRNAAKYDNKQPQVTFDKALPLETLEPGTFENFCFYLISKIDRQAKVSRFGGTGHKQDGIDIQATYNDGKYFTFQCKREEEFGPAKVAAAVVANTLKADGKVLMLSRVASPAARKEIQKYEKQGWELWDKDDMSRRFRDLPRVEQKKIIQIFFTGRQFDLIGEPEGSPWQSQDEFFLPYLQRKSGFSHQWAIVGRTASIEEVKKSLDAGTKVTAVTGNGGAGKTRLIREVVNTLEQDNSKAIWLLPQTAKLTQKDLTDLGKLPKILVIDDAHDREDLDLLLQHSADQTNRTQLLVGIRPYGQRLLMSQASRFGIVKPDITEVKLGPLTVEESTLLAKEVLIEYGGDPDLAKPIAMATAECSLITVMAAQIVAKEKISIELTKNADELRNIVFDRFHTVLAGNFDATADEVSVKKLMNLIAAIQPISLNDGVLLALAEKVEGLPPAETNRLIRILHDGGILFERGQLYKLAPDLLGDYLIEHACVGAGGMPTGYIETLIPHLDETKFRNILLNVGKVEWRLNRSDSVGANIVEALWKNLGNTMEELSRRVSTVSAVAYYLPARSLKFAQSLIKAGNTSDGVVDILRAIAFDVHYLPEVCESLWKIGKHDQRVLNSNPAHAIRVLTELCAVEPRKPISHNELVVSFALNLTGKPDVWEGAYNPLDVLSGIMQTEGHQTYNERNSLVMKPFLVSWPAVKHLREQVIKRTIELLVSDDRKAAFTAAKFLSNCLRYPRGQFSQVVTEEQQRAWSSEFENTLTAIRDVLRNKPVDDWVRIEVFQSISWQAHHGFDKEKSIGAEIFATAPKTLEFDAKMVILDGMNIIYRNKDINEGLKEQEARLKKVAQALVAAHSPKSLVPILQDMVEDVERLSKNRPYGYRSLFNKIFELSPDTGAELCEMCLANPAGPLTEIAQFALSTIIRKDRSKGLEYARRMMDSGNRALAQTVGGAYGQVVFDPSVPEYIHEIGLITQLLTSTDPGVSSGALFAARRLADKDQGKAIELLRLVDISKSPTLAEDVFSGINDQFGVPYDAVKVGDLRAFLARLKEVPKIEGYWTEMFFAQMSKRHAETMYRFYKDRVMYAVAHKRWDIAPCADGSLNDTILRFKESGDFPAILADLAGWMAENIEAEPMFKYRAGELFRAIVTDYDDTVVSFLRDWIEVATVSEFKAIAQILENADPQFVINRPEFVEATVSRAKRLGDEIGETVVQALYSSAVSGMRSGTYGEPFPEDIMLRDKSERIMRELGPFAASYEMYEALLRHAQASIKRNMQEVLVE